MTLKSSFLVLTIGLALGLPGCVSPPAYTPASTTPVGGGAQEAIVVGVYQDRVVQYSEQSGPSDCPFSDWRVSFTTEFTKANGTYVYDSRNAKEFSVKANDTTLLETLNQTMRSEAPAILTWTTLTDRGCEYQHAQVVTGVAPLPKAPVG